jgi:ParB/RepB/Spo0J family partition protein
MADLKRIPVKQIRENPVALRSVNRQSEDYLGLLDSVRKRGVLIPILVREVEDPISKEKFYGISDGLHRYTATLDAGLNDIPAQVINMTDAEVEEAQVIANVQKIETKPVEYSKHLQRILGRNPTMTLTQLAGKLSKTATWLNERLGLLKLNAKIAELVDEGKINLSNAYALAKLPEDEQMGFVDRAISMTPAEFGGTVQARKKEIDAARRSGRDAEPAGFTPVPHLQKISDIKSEIDRPTIGPVLVREAQLKTPDEGFKMGLLWALHLDNRSIEVAKSKDEQRKKDAEANRIKATAERAKRKAEEAAAEAAKLQTVK